MEKMQIKKAKRGDADLIHLGGSMTEEAGLQLIQLYNEMGRKCIFNFRDVTHINSNGIRAWVLFLRDFQTDRDIDMEECTPIIVDQINMLSSFVQKAKIRSIYVPYMCTSCKAVTNVLIDAREFATAKTGLKSGRCKKCLAPTEGPDADDYFSFVKD